MSHYTFIMRGDGIVNVIVSPWQIFLNRLVCTLHNYSDLYVNAVNVYCIVLLYITARTLCLSYKQSMFSFVKRNSQSLDGDSLMTLSWPVLFTHTYEYVILQLLISSDVLSTDVYSKLNMHASEPYSTCIHSSLMH